MGEAAEGCSVRQKDCVEIDRKAAEPFAIS